MELRGTKIALAAVLACLLSLTAWLGVSQMVARAAGEATASAGATYNPFEDSITVTSDGENGFRFFTVANASKKVPAANQWVTTNDGKVYLSSKSGASVYYFADSTSPKIEEIVAVEVPAVPTIAKVKYTAGATTAAEAFEVDVKYSYFDKDKWKAVSKKATKVDNKLIGYNGYGESSLADIMTPYEDEEMSYLAKLQKFGGVLNLNVVSGYYGYFENDAWKEVNNTEAAYVDVSSNEKVNIKTLLAFNTAEGFVPLRLGASKQVKIAKAATGPAVKIDYANHMFTIKKGAEAYKQDDAYSEIASGDAASKTYWDAKSAAVKLYDQNVSEEPSYYIVRTQKTEKKAASTFTHVIIPAAEKFSKYASATISGMPKGDATLLIDQTGKADASSDAKSIVYQYAIANAEATDYVNADGTFNYEKSVASGTKLSWKSVTLKRSVKNNTNNTKASVTLKASALSKGKVVFVRRAAIAKDAEYSSQVEVFTIPGEGGVWTKATQAAVSTKESLPSVTISSLGNNKFKVSVASGDAFVDATKKTEVSFGKVVFESEASGDAAILSVKSGGSKLAVKKELTIKFTIPEGYVKNSAGTTNAAYTYTLEKVNTIIPKLTKSAYKDKVVTYTFDTTMTGATGTATVKYTASGNAATTNPVSLTPSGKTMTLNVSSAGDYVVELTSVKLNENDADLTTNSDAKKQEFKVE